VRDKSGYPAATKERGVVAISPTRRGAGSCCGCWQDMGYCR